MKGELASYNSGQHPGNDADTVQTIKMVTEQNDRLSKMVKTLLDMSELQTVAGMRRSWSMLLWMRYWQT